jgi:hypothetical protein
MPVSWYVFINTLEQCHGIAGMGYIALLYCLLAAMAKCSRNTSNTILVQIFLSNKSCLSRDIVALNLSSGFKTQIVRSAELLWELYPTFLCVHSDSISNNTDIIVVNASNERVSLGAAGSMTL